MNPSPPPAAAARPATGLLSVAELPIWVPGEILTASDDLGWHDVAQRSYRYQGQDVEIPPLADFMIVHYRQGSTPMDREFDGRWTRTQCEPGHFSLLSRAAASHWHWTEGLVVSHVYLSDALMRRVAGDMQGQEVAEVRFHDVLRGVDDNVTRIAGEMTREAAGQGIGGPLYAEALSVQLAVHLLNRYATCAFKAVPDACRLSERQLRQLREYVDEHLHGHITLAQMAEALGMGVWTLNRHLRRTLNQSAYAFVVERRVKRACELLRAGDLSIKAIAADTGFSDQAHLTRALRARLGVTPRQYRLQG